MAVKGKGKQIAGKAPAASASSSGKRKNNQLDGESSGIPPKKKPSGVLRFVDDAAVDADYDGEKEEEDDLEWEIDEDFDFELPDIGAKVVKNVSKGPGKSSPLPFFIKEEVMNDDELEEAIMERYRGSDFISFDDDVKECNETLLVSHATKDLSIWRVKCMMGRERQTSFCLMQKFVDLQKIGKKLHIFSVFALDHVKGFVYVEADKAGNVFEACNGLCFLYPSRIELVPRNETPNLLSIQKKSSGISKGMWVRLKNGKYKGDLAEVIFVNDSKKRVTIKLVPRIDLQAIAKKFGGGTSLKAAAIPAPRLISPHELEDFRPHIEVRRDRETGEIFEVLDGLMLKDGYLYKKVSICSLIHWGVQPSSDELTKFEDMGNDGVKDVGWLSSIYKTQIKNKLPETSHQKNGEKPNQKNGEKSNQKNGEKSNRKNGEKSQKDEDKQRNGFEIDDFVLFGKKGCGIIIDKENDVFKVLKGDANSSEVVSINIGVIKKNCIDKVFTATDRGMKTIFIDDVVKVSEGPLEGREGIVKHMYKGVFFIYDECQSENNGFFCAKSEICDLVKKSRDFGSGKLSSNAGPSFAQSPIRSSDQDDNSQSFSRNRQSNSRGTFSVGQTLRICKGPLKGYLCRVIRLYRADVTVKLDSLGKLLTVDEKLLSFPNSKRDDATTMQCDMFGSQEEQPTGGLLDAGGGFGMDNSSFGRESWNTPSCSGFSFSRDNDSKDQSTVADLWGSKPTSQNGDQDHGAANSWGKAPSSGAEQRSWNKMESGEKGADADCKNDADAWNKASTKGETSTGGWQDDISVQKTGQTWSTKGASGGWDGAVHTADEGVSAAGSWSKSAPDSGEALTFGEEGWNRAASKPHSASNTETSGWEQTKLPSSDSGGSWNAQGASAGWSKEASGKDKSDGFVGKSGNSASPKSGGDNLDSWGIKGKALLENNDDSWGKSAPSQETITVPNNPWQSSFNSSIQSKALKSPSAGESQAVGWGTSPSECAAQTSSWDKVKTAPTLIDSEKSATEIGGWKKATDGNQASGWASSATPSDGDGSESNSWDKVKSLPSSSGWENSKATATETSGGWKTTMNGNQKAGWGASAMPSAPSAELEKSSSGNVNISSSSRGWQISKQAEVFSSEGQIDRWNKEKSSDGNQASGWNKAGNAEGGKDIWATSWDKAKGSEGSGFGQQNQGEWKAGDDWGNNTNFGKSKDSDSGQGSGWSQGNFSNENGKSWGGHDNSWNQQRDFEGGRGGSNNRGRGRGRYGGRGGRNEDNFQKPGDSDGGWRFGRGGGRGRNGAGGYNRDNSGTREFGRGRGRGQGRGRVQDQGQFESSGWRNGQERFSGGFSNKPSSSWGTTEGGGWGTGGNKYDGGNIPAWGTAPQDAGGSKNDLNEDHTSSWSKGVSSSRQTDNCGKETRNNDNWNSPKTFENKLTGWNQTSDDTSTDTNEMKSMNASNSSELTFADWGHGLSEDKGTTNDEKWTKPKSSPGDHCDTLSGKLNSNDNWETAGGSQGGWSSKKVHTQASQPSSEPDNNWGKFKEPCSDSTAGNLGSSKDWGGKNSANWVSKTTPASNPGNWGGKDSSGNQIADWNNGGVNKWGQQSGDQGRSESWKRGSDFGRGGGRGRDNSFSRGRGFGRNSGRHHSHGWNSNDDSNRESNYAVGESFNSSNEDIKTGGSWSGGSGTFEAEKSSWNSGRKSEGENQAKQGGWVPSASSSINKIESSSGSWNPGSSKGSSNNDGSTNLDWPSNEWGSKSETLSRRSDFGGVGGRGRDNSFTSSVRLGINPGGRGYGKQIDDERQAFNLNQEFKTGGSWNGGGKAEKGSWGGWKSEGENLPSGQAKPRSEAESSWDSPTGFSSNKASAGTNSGEQKNDPWASTNATSKTGQDSTIGSSDEKQKHCLAENDRVGSWDTNNSQSEDGNTKKLGSGWTSGTEGSLPGQSEAPKWGSSWVRQDGDQSNSGNGGNSGW